VNATDDKTIRTLNGMLEAYGLETYKPPSDSAHTQEMTLGEWLGDSVDLGEEVGTPGTKVWSGRIYAEPNGKYTPIIVRGVSGNAGLYEEYYRGEVKVFDSVRSNTEVLVSADWTVEPGKHCPDELQDLARNFAEWATRRLLAIDGGWDHFIEHAASMQVFGFAPFEIVWNDIEDENPARFPIKLAFREQSTVWEWCFNDRLTKLLGAKFQPGGEESKQYTLPARGEAVDDHKLLLVNVNARGNNVEGIPPLRPAIFWIKTKQLLAQIQSATAEKYGVPTAVVRDDPAFAEMFQAADEAKDDTYDILKWQRSREMPVMQLERGVLIEYLQAQGTMPNLQEAINYCDQMITAPFSNEGSLIGLQSSVGSWALADVKDRQSMRSAPALARRIARPVEGLLRLMARTYDPRLEAVPFELSMSLDGAQDNQAWTSDLAEVMSAGLMTWPKKIQVSVLEKFGLPADALESDEIEEPNAEQDEPGSEDEATQIAASESCGCAYHLAEVDLTPTKEMAEAAQQGLDYRDEYGRGGTRTGIARARDISNRTNLSSKTVGRMVSFFARHEQNRDPDSTEDDGGPTNGWIAWLLWGGDPARDWAQRKQAELERKDLAEDYDTSKLRNFNVDEAVASQSNVERDVADQLSAIASDHQSRWRELIADNDSKEDIEPDKERIRSEFLPRYQAIVRGGAEAMAETAARQMLRDYGMTDFDDVDMPTPDAVALRTLANSLGEEAFNRQQGMFNRATVAAQAGAKDVELPLLKPRTYERIAATAIGRSYNAGRDAVIEQAKRTAAGEEPEIEAWRSSVLDVNTCKVCRGLNGPENSTVLVGSPEYFRLMPGNQCLGGDLCRCVWIYEAPATLVQNVLDALRSQ
jgi:hypothetical protein